MTSAFDVLKIARSEIGYKENPPNSNGSKFGDWYGLNYQPWCAMFVSYCFYNAGLALPITKPTGFAYCPYGIKWFKEQRKWFQNPKLGDVVFYDWQNDGISDHVGLVEQVNNDGSIIAIEGNTSNSNNSNGGQVMRRKRYRKNICGFGRPDYNNFELNKEQSFPAWRGRNISLTSPCTEGVDVLMWQRQMIKRNFDLGNSGLTKKGDDSIFGQRSYQALLKFQSQISELEQDGILGVNTWRKTWTAPM